MTNENATIPAAGKTIEAKATKTAMKDEAVRVEDTFKAADIRETTATIAGKVTDGAREFVRRSALTAQERADDVYGSVETFNDNVETAMTRLVGGYVSILDGVAKAAHEDANRFFVTIEKLAGATSLTEAVRIQSDYVRENTAANVERVRTAATRTRDVVSNGAAVVRETLASRLPMRRAA